MQGRDPGQGDQLLPVVTTGSPHREGMAERQGKCAGECMWERGVLASVLRHEVIRPAVPPAEGRRQCVLVREREKCPVAGTGCEPHAARRAAEVERKGSRN